MQFSSFRFRPHFQSPYSIPNLPGIGDDSNRFLQSLLNALVAEGTVEYNDVTAGLEMKALHLDLSLYTDHIADMKILKCRRKFSMLQESIHDVFVPGNISLA